MRFRKQPIKKLSDESQNSIKLGNDTDIESICKPLSEMSLEKGMTEAQSKLK
jgi:hypothetical protein